MIELVLAITLFIVSHIVLIQAPLRARMESLFGKTVFSVLYSLMSIALLVWVAKSFADAPYIQLWPTTLVSTWIPVFVMPFACTLLVAGLFSPNPLSLSVRKKPFDPSRPGIVSITRHPVMWAFILWAGSHMPANGDLASFLLFGLMLGLSLYGCKAIDRNKKTRLGSAKWKELSHNTSIVPFAAIIVGKTSLSRRSISLTHVMFGLLIYVLLTYFHVKVIGVAPPVVALFH